MGNHLRIVVDNNQADWNKNFSNDLQIINSWPVRMILAHASLIGVYFHFRNTWKSAFLSMSSKNIIICSCEIFEKSLFTLIQPFEFFQKEGGSIRKNSDDVLLKYYFSPL